MAHLIKSALVAALAVTPMLALSSAHAQSVAVRISDLDLSRPAQAQEFKARVAQAADKFCGSYTDQRNLSRVAACKHGVRDEMQEKAASHGYQQARSGSMTVATR